MRELLKCVVCNEYTMNDTHCDNKTLPVKPAKWSPEDKYGEYRRRAKKELI